MITKDKTVVDFTPTIVNNDLQKLYDHGLVKINQIVTTILHTLYMERGTLDEFPEAGSFNDVLNLYYAESVEQIQSAISKGLSRYNRNDIDCQIIRDDSDSRLAYIMITVSGIPSLKFTADIIRNDRRVNIVNPNIMEI